VNFLFKYHQKPQETEHRKKRKKEREHIKKRKRKKEKKKKKKISKSLFKYRGSQYSKRRKTLQLQNLFLYDSIFSPSIIPFQKPLPKSLRKFY
jgi:hypothetical protein